MVAAVLFFAAPTRWPIKFPKFVTDFKAIRDDEAKLSPWETQHEGQEVAWDGIIETIRLNGVDGVYRIAATPGAAGTDCVVADFGYIDKRFNVGDSVTFVGAFDGSLLGQAKVKNCRFGRPKIVWPLPGVAAVACFVSAWLCKRRTPRVPIVGP